MFAVNNALLRLVVAAMLSSSLLLSVSAQADEAQRAAEAAMAAASELSDDELSNIEEEIVFTESEMAGDEGSYDGTDYSDASSYSSDPVRLELGFDFIGQMQMNYLIVRAKEDVVVLHDVVINRGNCGYTLSGRMDAPFPVNIAFGNAAKYLLKCSTVLEVTVNTNFGEHTYTFGQ